MANRNFDRGYVVGKRLVEITGSFIPLAGSGTVTASSVKGLGFGYAPVNGTMALQPNARPGINSTPGIVRTTTGTYTIILDDSYRDCNKFSCDLAVPAGGSQNWAQPQASISNLATSGTAPTFTLFTVNNSGSPTDVGTTYRVYFSIQLEDSTVQFQKP